MNKYIDIERKLFSSDHQVQYDSNEFTSWKYDFPKKPHNQLWMGEEKGVNFYSYEEIYEKFRHMVILGQSGIGKSTFIKNKVESMKIDHIYINLIAPVPLFDLISEKNAFRKFLQQPKELLLVFDNFYGYSNSPIQLKEELIHSFEKLPEESRQFIKVCLICRSGFWNNEFLDIFNLIQLNESKEPNYEVLKLIPFTEKQARQFVQEKISTNNISSFFEGINKKALGSMANSPQTLSFLLDIFKEHEYFPDNRYDIFFEGIRTLCRPSSDLGSISTKYTEDQVVSGTSFIATSSLFTHLGNISLSERKPNKILSIDDLSQIMPIFEKHLLIYCIQNTGLFTESENGRKIWVHDNHRDFLVALFFVEEIFPGKDLDQKMSIIENLFLSKNNKIYPQLNNILEFICLKDPILLESLLEYNPFILYSWDIKHYKLKNKKETVKTIVDFFPRFRQGYFPNLRSNILSLNYPGIEKDLLEIYNEIKEDEIKIEILLSFFDLFIHPSFRPALKEIKANNRFYLKIRALRNLIKLGNMDDINQLKDQLKTEDNSSKLYAELLTRLYSHNFLSIHDVFSLIPAPKKEKKSTFLTEYYELFSLIFTFLDKTDVKKIDVAEVINWCSTIPNDIFNSSDYVFGYETATILALNFLVTNSSYWKNEDSPKIMELLMSFLENAPRYYDCDENIEELPRLDQKTMKLLCYLMKNTEFRKNFAEYWIDRPHPQYIWHGIINQEEDAEWILENYLTTRNEKWFTIFHNFIYNFLRKKENRRKFKDIKPLLKNKIPFLYKPQIVQTFLRRKSHLNEALRKRKKASRNRMKQEKKKKINQIKKFKRKILKLLHKKKYAEILEIQQFFSRIDDLWEKIPIDLRLRLLYFVDASLYKEILSNVEKNDITLEWWFIYNKGRFENKFHLNLWSNFNQYIPFIVKTGIINSLIDEEDKNNGEIHEKIKEHQEIFQDILMKREILEILLDWNYFRIIESNVLNFSDFEKEKLLIHYLDFITYSTSNLLFIFNKIFQLLPENKSIQDKILNFLSNMHLSNGDNFRKSIHRIEETLYWRLVFEYIKIDESDKFIDMLTNFSPSIYLDEYFSKLTIDQCQQILDYIISIKEKFMTNYENEFFQICYSIAQFIAKTGSEKSKQIIELINSLYPEKIRVENYIEEGEWRNLAENWFPFQLKPLWDFILKDEITDISNEDAFKNLIFDCLEQIESEYRDETSMMHTFWSYDKKNRKNIFWPKYEVDFSDIIAFNLKKKLHSKGIFINREIGINRESNRIDIKCEMQSQSIQLTCYIEVKGCWNEEISTHLNIQLYKKYLKQNQCKAGIFLALWCVCDLWRDDNRKKRAIRIASKKSDLTKVLEDQLNTIPIADREMIKIKIFDATI